MNAPVRNVGRAESRSGEPVGQLRRVRRTRRYAAGGEVSIDPSALSGDPAATVQRMRRIQRAALAPADPSPQRQVVAQAARKAAEAQRELNGPDREKGSLVDLTA